MSPSPTGSGRSADFTLVKVIQLPHVLDAWYDRRNLYLSVSYTEVFIKASALLCSIPFVQIARCFFSVLRLACLLIIDIGSIALGLLGGVFADKNYSPLFFQGARNIIPHISCKIVDICIAVPLIFPLYLSAFYMYYSPFHGIRAFAKIERWMNVTSKEHDFLRNERNKGIMMLFDIELKQNFYHAYCMQPLCRKNWKIIPNSQTKKHNSKSGMPNPIEGLG
ncbi:MAG: hypothetical protein AAGF04_05245 [Chlamydiota bacterium]